MLDFFYNEYNFFIPFIMLFFYNWLFFIKNNFFLTRIKPSFFEKTKNSNVFKKLDTQIFLNWLLVVIFFMYINIFFYIEEQKVFWWGHFKTTNFNSKIILFLFLFSFGFFYMLNNINKDNINNNVDYYFTLSNLIFFLSLIFFSNTLYTFFFLLEVNSSFIFYKFIISKFWLKQKNTSNNTTNQNFNKILPKFYLNMIFFQYWVSFFSSILLLYSVINFLYFFGSTEWVIIDFFNFNQTKLNNTLSLFFNSIILVTFFIGFFLKIGFTPVHLFKIEVYKGLPFISIFFYTTYYFLVFFLILVLIINTNFYFTTLNIWFIFIGFVIVGGLYILFLFFDVNFIKAFFAYSTIINTYSLLLILLV